MLYNILIKIFTSPIWIKLFIDFIILYYFLHIQRMTSRPVTRIFPALISVLICRDIIYLLFRSGDFILIADFLIISVYLVWLRLYTGQKKTDYIILAPSALIVAFLFFNALFIIIPPFWSFIFRSILIIFSFYLTIILYQVSSFNTKNSEIIIETRKIISIVFISYNFLMIFAGENNPIAHAFIIPISNFVHFFLLDNYAYDFGQANSARIKALESDIDSLFDFMRNIGNAIKERVELNSVLNYIVNSAVQNTRAEAGAILLIDEYEDVLNVKAMSGKFPPPYPVPDSVKKWTRSIEGYFESTPIKIGETILGETVTTGKPVFIRNTIEDPKMEQNTKSDALFISSIIIVPLLVSSKILGVLAVIKKKSDDFFENADYQNIRTFADYASLTLDNLLTYLELMEKREIEREVGIAADIQLKLLPRKLPSVHDAAITAFSIPAKGVSGDYYDVIPVKKGKVAFVICDVAGKGVPAALVMVMIRSIIHLIAGASKDAATIVNWINRGLTGHIDIDHFATLSFLTYDPSTRTIEYSNAGHHPLLFIESKNGAVHNIDTEGIPIGIEKNTKYLQRKVHLNKNDILVLYTDGIIEAMNNKGEQYSYESLQKLVVDNRDQTVEKISALLKDDIKKFVGNAKQHDDQTLMIIKIK